MKQLILGTVQLGMNYGVNNKIGKPSKDEAFSLLESAYENGIQILDTASVYGDSEKIIGEFIKSQNKPFKVITKLKKLDKERDAIKQVDESISASLHKLSLPKIDYYLYHSFEDLVNNKNVFEYLIDLKKRYIIEKIGVSIYDTEELEYILANLSQNIDFVQIPFNIFDLRWLKHDLLRNAKDKNIEIAARSIFLQGLFFANEDVASKIHPTAYEYLTKLKDLSESKEITVQQLAMNFVKHQKYIDYLLIGCESKEQLLANINNFNQNIEFSLEDYEFILRTFSSIDKKIIDPRQW